MIFAISLFQKNPLFSALDGVELQNNGDFMALEKHTKIARNSYERLVQVSANVDVISARITNMHRVMRQKKKTFFFFWKKNY